MGVCNLIRPACRPKATRLFWTGHHRVVAPHARKGFALALIGGLLVPAFMATGDATAAATAPARNSAGAAQSRNAGPLRIAVAANFRAPLHELASTFEQIHGTAASLTFGSSGLLAAQIRQGAPFDAFFSADTMRPAALIGDGLAAAPLTVYARGRVAVRTTRRRGNPAQAGIPRIGLPNPDLAPYGVAAVQCLQRLGLWQRVQGRLVFGNNVNQVDHFLEAGALDTGFVALSQLVARDIAAERYWVCPTRFHKPIEQGAVVLNRARNPAAARSLLRFMAGSGTQARLAQLGYNPGD